ncbi:MAG: hypothetical protein FJ087_02140 [Deltaproteobacteria bacterium]|nr:hypothetical protein [Deltaproteobacteria bacterium]
MTTQWILTAFALGLSLAACEAAAGPAAGPDAAVEAGADVPAAGGDTAVPGNDAGGVPRLREGHPGWRQARCLDCHGATAPLPHQPGRYRPPDCAGCHGYNGARHRDHAADPAGTCAGCHATGAVAPDHLDDFDIPRECAQCHVHPASPEGF